MWSIIRNQKKKGRMDWRRDQETSSAVQKARQSLVCDFQEISGPNRERCKKQILYDTQKGCDQSAVGTTLDVYSSVHKMQEEPRTIRWYGADVRKQAILQARTKEEQRKN